MYQSVGVELTPQIADALGLPLYRRAISGSSLLTEKNAYSPLQGDETEDLFLLLQDVKQKHPEVTAVASGAVFSDYQRLRVESVCQRLGLTSLAFLWRQPQDVLLDQVIDSELEAVLVKTASMGLDASHLGQSIRNLRPHFQKLHQQFGFHVCGEGGEYESLTLDGPLFTKKVQLPEWEIVNHGGDAFYISIKGQAEIIAKDDDTRKRKCSVLEKFESLLYYAQSFPIKAISSETHPSSTPITQGTRAVSSTGSPRIVSFGNGYATSSLDRRILGVESMEAKDFFAAAVSFLETQAWTLGECFMVELQVADMSRFAAVNSEYNLFFPASEPPARFCVETVLPDDVPVRMRLLLSRTRKETTHVQSISTWGMACVGPYSQSARIKDVGFFTAGVLGMIPHSMTLVTSAQAEPHAGAPIAPWCAQLWIAMRTQRNICSINGHEDEDDDNPVAVQVFVAAGRTPSLQRSNAVMDAVRQYCSKESIIFAQSVPVLPKDASIEISFIYPQSTGTNPTDEEFPENLGRETRHGVSVLWFERLPSSLPTLEDKAVQVAYVAEGQSEDAIRAVLPGASLLPCVELGKPKATICLFWLS